MDLLLLPGMDGTGRLFGRLLEELPDTVRPEVVTYPTDEELGYDELQPRITARAPEAPYVVLGESFSGPLALRHAASRPAGLRGVILSATFARNPAPWGTAPLLAWMGPVPFRARPPRLVVRGLLTGFDASDAVVDDAITVAGLVEPRVWSHRLREVFAVDVREELPAIDVPVLYLLGTRDRIVGRRGLRSLRKGLAHLHVVELDAPHQVLQTRPAQACRAIVEFLQRELGGTD